MSNTYILPPVVFAFVPGMGTVVSRPTAPPSRSMESASVASTAAAKMLTVVHNNVRYPGIASLPFFTSRLLSAPGYSSPFWIKVQPEVSIGRDDLEWRCWQGLLKPLFSTSVERSTAVAPVLPSVHESVADMPKRRRSARHVMSSNLGAPSHARSCRAVLPQT